ncbi:MAG: hypothetical protein NC223_09395 [Butyrivibrio sp.]|nr:hypothetical protein [Butyrivibrio sp.]
MSGISTLFSGMNTSSLSSSIYGSLSEYAIIRSGAYHKLAQKYYYSDGSAGSSGITRKVPSTEYDYKRGDYKKNLDSPSKSESSVTSKSTSTSKATTANIAEIEKSTESLKKSSEALTQRGSSSVFKQTSGKYDTDKIYDAVSAFVKDYNSVVDSASGSKSASISKRAASMTNLTASNAKLLSKIGITVGSDKKLSIDSETFKKADMGQVKSLFNTSGGYGYQVGANASMIEYAAQNEASRANTYTGYGSYSNNYTSGSLFNYGL